MKFLSRMGCWQIDGLLIFLTFLLFLQICFEIEMQVDEDEPYWRQRKEDEELECSHNSTHLISHLAQCLSKLILSLNLMLLSP